MPSQLDMLAARITTQLLTLGDVATSAGVDLSGAQGAVGDAVEAVQDDSKRGGFFGPFAALFESILKARPRSKRGSDACAATHETGTPIMPPIGHQPIVTKPPLLMRRRGNVNNKTAALSGRALNLAGCCASSVTLCVFQVLDKGLDTLHVPYSYGFSIILLTLLVKVATFPLTKKQARTQQSPL